MCAYLSTIDKHAVECQWLAHLITIKANLVKEMVKMEFFYDEESREITVSVTKERNFN